MYRTSRFLYENKRTSNWCATIHKLAIKYNLLDLWQNENTISDISANSNTIRNNWYNLIRRKIHQVEEENWLKQVTTKPKLRTYRTFKRSLKLEQYLLSEKNKDGRYLVTRLRSGTNDLRIIGTMEETKGERRRKKEQQENNERRTSIEITTRRRRRRMM